MNSPKNFLLLLLAATTIGGAVLSWRQYAELVELRAAALNPDLRADLERRVADLEKLNRELQDQLAAQRAGNTMEDLLAGATEERSTSSRGRGEGERSRGGRGDPRGGRGDFGQQQSNALRELMNKPEVQAMMNLQQKAAIEARYAALFKNLNLAPEQVEKLKSLLADRSVTMQDVMSAAREQGINPRENPEAFRKLLNDAQNQINSGIKSVIGEAGFAQLQNFEQTMPQRSLVNELQQRLSYTSTPLSASQAEQLVNILAANSPQPLTRPTSTNPAASSSAPPPNRGPAGPPSFGGRGDFGFIAAPGGPGMGFGSGDGGRGGGVATVTPAAVAQAQGILTPSQLAALAQIQQQQQSQQQLQQLIRETLAANQPPPRGGTNTTAGGSGTGASTGTGGTSTGGAPPRKRPGGE